MVLLKKRKTNIRYYKLLYSDLDISVKFVEQYFDSFMKYIIDNDIVIASKLLPESKVRCPLIRRFMSIIFDFLALPLYLSVFLYPLVPQPLSSLCRVFFILPCKAKSTSCQSM